MPTEGDVLNQRYQILRVLSDKGGMGVIYQAHDLNLNGTVVIKQSRFTEQELRRQFPHWPTQQVLGQVEYLRKAFEREAKLLFGLRHSALPRVLDYFATADGNQFFVMEFIPGKDFAELLAERLRQKQGPFPLEQVLDWAEQMIDALYYLHTEFDPPIIHRDIKPMNLKLMPKGQVILLDFGLAKGARPGMSVAESILGGTPHYAPLEQINRKTNQQQPTDPRSDIYSLAVTLYHLLTGELPPDAVERVQAVAQGEPDPLRPAHELAPAIPVTVSMALQRAAAVFIKERVASAAELRQLLRQPVTPAPPTIVMPPPQPEPPTIPLPRPAPPQPFSEDLGDGVKLEMIYLPGGAFQMGSDDYDREKPIHRVTLSPFFIGKYPVTQAQWRAVMNTDPSDFKGADLPVESVSWEDAVKFCQRLGQRANHQYRLPTEAEWEYACRAGSTGKWCFGEDEGLLEQYAWYYKNSGNQTRPVGQKQPNQFGLYDLHGNVWEWCQDWYDAEYYGKSPERDPQGPDKGTYRVLRGGSWGYLSDYCRSAYRNYFEPGDRFNIIGLRVVVSARTFAPSAL
jgi:formylglycine-generating enzyme required for sulfatase activity